MRRKMRRERAENFFLIYLSIFRVDKTEKPIILPADEFNYMFYY